jgi:alpha,alpha-trehalose phosphorylase
MSGPEAFEVDPWGLRETALDLDGLGHSESVFALANGHIGLRGTFEESEPRVVPGTYLNGFYEERPLPYAEAGYGFPESGQTVVSVTDGKVVRLLVDDEPLDLRYGTVTAHERFLCFRTGVLERRTDWTSPTGRSIRVTTRRLVSFTQRAVAAIEYTVEPIDGAAMWLVAQSELLANESLPAGNGDPRAAAALDAPLRNELSVGSGTRAVLCHRTRVSGLGVAAGMEHHVHAPSGGPTELVVEDDLARLTVATRVAPGERLHLVKYLAYGWSAQRSPAALRAQVDAALSAAASSEFDGLVADQTEFLADFWGSADVELDGDDQIQQAVRFALFHALQAGARGEQRALPAKGLTGPGYDGHTFWDTETFVLPLLTYTLPRPPATP